jgi:hypothetical protein
MHILFSELLHYSHNSRPPEAVIWHTIFGSQSDMYFLLLFYLIIYAGKGFGKGCIWTEFLLPSWMCVCYYLIEEALGLEPDIESTTGIPVSLFLHDYCYSYAIYLGDLICTWHLYYLKRTKLFCIPPKLRSVGLFSSIVQSTGFLYRSTATTGKRLRENL